MLACAHGAIERISPLISPRRRGGDHSIASGIAAEYSPATKIPHRKRRSRTSATVPPPSRSWVGAAAVASAHAGVPAIATRVVRVRPRRSEIRPNTIPPTGRPKSIATMISAAVDAVAAGPASTSMAGASAVTGRNTWTLSMKLPTTPARRAARPAGGRAAGVRATGAEDAALIDPLRPTPRAGTPRPDAWGGSVAPARRTPARDGTRADGRAPPRPGPRGS